MKDNQMSNNDDQPNNREEQPAQTDVHLQGLVSLVNNTDLRIPITISIYGGVMSGRLVSGKTYFEQFADIFVKGLNASSEDTEEIRKNYASMGAIFGRKNDDDDTAQPLPQFLHLIDAQYVSPGQLGMPTNAGLVWRGRISSVSGFSLGMLQSE